MRRAVLILGILLTSLLPLATWAGGISVSEALAIAKEFMKQQDMSFVPDTRDRSTKGTGETGYYVFNGDRQTGFVVVCADDRAAMPVLAYARSGSFDYDRLPPNAKAWMDQYTRDIRMLDESQIRRAGVYSETLTAIIIRPKSVEPVEPLLTTAWGQGSPYNQQCPLVGGQRTLTGCGATALAQIMYYHQWPEKGKGSVKYTWESTGKKISQSLSSSTYRWDVMTPTYGEGSTTAAQNAVALLMRDCGYAQKMDYGLSYSGSYPEDIPMALTTYFGYESTVRLVERDSYTGDWESLLRSELDNRRPVFYAGYGTGGHAFVCDGYDRAGYFHFNFGWNGDANGYFAVSAITPNRSDYSYGHVAVVGIRKPDIAVTSVKLSKSSVTIKDNETAQLTATVLPAAATNKDVTWSSSDESVATVDENGLVTPGSVLGKTTITCTSVSTPAKKATCKVTVKTSKVAVTSVKLNKSSLTIKDNETVQLTATVLPSNATDKSVTWSSSNENVATVDENGLVTPGSVLGKATITCTSVSTPAKKATCKVTVKTSKVAVTSVKLSKTSQSLKAGSTFQLTATVGPGDAYDKSVIWTSSNEAVATVDANGLVTAIIPGTATITCQSVYTPTKKGTCRITVTKAATRGTVDDEDDAFNASSSESAQTFDVYDLRGRKILSNVTSLNGLPKGIYIVNGKKIVLHPLF